MVARVCGLPVEDPYWVLEVTRMRKAVFIGAAVIAVLVLGATAVVRPAASGQTEQMVGRAHSPATSAQVPHEFSVEITIAAVGDVMVHESQLRAAKAAGGGGSYDFTSSLALVAPYLRMADYTIANLETRLAGDGFAYTSYPRFNSPGELAWGLRWAGVDLLATANNHTLDKRWTGVVNTLACLDEAGLAHVGTHRSLEEKSATSPLIVDIRGIKVAFINYTDYLNEFTPPKDHKDYAVNFLEDPDQIAAEAAAARAAGADVVIALPHWGREYWAHPREKEVEYAQGSDDYPGLLALGVDVILGSHPHVLQPALRVRQETPSGGRDSYVVYSMGNFVSGMDGRYTNGGVIVYVHIRRQREQVEVTGLSYVGTYVQTFGPYPRQVRVLPVLPGADLGSGVYVNALEQRKMERVWSTLTKMFYKPDMNILPLDPEELAASEE